MIVVAVEIVLLVAGVLDNSNGLEVVRVAKRRRSGEYCFNSTG